jgi:hypothetical protein
MAGRTKHVPAGQLTVDPRVQRDHLTIAKVNKIREAFDKDALQTLQVSQREDGTLVILDGWHRWTVVMEMEDLGADFKLECKVHTGLTLQDEAKLFVLFNVQEAANKLDLHKARATQGDVVAVTIDEVVAKHGWEVGKGDGKIRAVVALEAIYYVGENHLDGFGSTHLSNSLGVVTDAWGRDDVKAVDQNILKAVSEFLISIEKHWVDPDKGRELELEVLTTAMSGLKHGPTGWLAACRGQADGSAKSLRQILLGELLTLYNKGRRSGKVPAAVLS